LYHVDTKIKGISHYS